MTVMAGDEVRTKVAVSWTEDDLVMLRPLHAVFHQIAIDTHISIRVITVSLRSNVHSSTAHTHTVPTGKQVRPRTINLYWLRTATVLPSWLFASNTVSCHT